jgi:EAL domain-containing protein (putative c-di-GMP-specific phosphodiesterase class I)/AmiR/NasT family two-component response regulator
MLIADLHFLVAEDHEFQRGGLVRILAGLGAKNIYQAADGQSALLIVDDPASRVDIIISDLDMPGMDGMEFIRRLGHAHTPVSMVVASSLSSTLIASVANMAEAYGITLLGVVEKPLTSKKLLPLIERHQPRPAEPKRVAAPTFTLDEVEAGLKNDEFEPFFQPKIELATGRIKGAEALARWRHGRQGIVSPSAFIRLLEDNGLVDELTWIMLRKAAACCSAWRKTGVDATVSVNLSTKSLDDTEIAGRVTELVRSQDIAPRNMVLEVTESAATIDVGRTLENLARLRMRGFGLSIDDYGTGYSSMQQLARIAFTELKIDQSFVTGAAKQRSARAILESSVRMAKKLSIASVAEGVETRDAFDLLCRIRCEMAQGYFIAAPMEYTAFRTWVRHWNEPGRVQLDEHDVKSGAAGAQRTRQRRCHRG